MQAGFAALAKEMEAAQKTTAHPDNIKVYQQQIDALNRLRNGYGDVAGLNTMIQATGQYTVETVKSISATQAFAKSLADQKIGISKFITNFSQMRQQIRAFTDEQIALQKASAMQWTQNGVGGKSLTDLYVPKDVGPALNDMKARYGALNYTIGQMGKATLDWGKNTQWAGRQLTAGLTMPILAAAAGVATVAYNVNEAITKIVKMYNTSDIEKAYTDPAQQAIVKEQELAQVRKDALTNAIGMAKQYGSAINDTLNIEAQMASKGYTGAGLQQMTNATMKMSAVGSISPTDAMNTTMSMISAYKIAPSELNDAMNFLNALKNNTNLTMQDISNAIPRVGATIASLVPPSDDATKALKETGIMLAAFAEGGVQAAQGANALKTAIARAFDPVPKATKEFGQLTSAVAEFAGKDGKGIDLTKIKAASGGDPLTYFTNLGKAMANVDAQSKETALKDLFGIQQSNRMLVMLQNLMNANPMTQTGAAERLANSSADIWANITDQEVKQFQESASGKLKIAVETLKGEFAKMGDPIINALTPVVGVVTNIVHLLNNMPSVFKSAFGHGLIIMSLIGPVIMLTGLFANMAGMVAKTTTSFANLFLRFKPLTAEQRANELIARTATQTYNAEAQAVATLAIKMKELTDVMLQNQATQQDMTLGSGNAAVDSYGKHAAPVLGVPGVASASEEAAAATEKTKVNLRAIAGGAAALGLTALSIKQIASGTTDWGTQLINVSLILASMGGGGFFSAIKSRFASVVADAGGLAEAGGRFKVAWTVALNAVQAGFKGLLSAAKWLFTNPFGIALVAITAIATALTIAIKNENKLSAAQEEVNKSTQAWADVLGYTEKQISLTDKSAQTGISAYKARSDAVKKLASDNNALVASLQRANAAGGDQLYNMAVTEALKAAASGASKTQALQAFQVALQAGGANTATIDKLTVKFRSVGLDNPTQVGDELMQQVQTALDSVQPNDKVATSLWDKTFHPDKLKDEARATISEVTNLMTHAMDNASTPQEKFTIGTQFEDQMNGFWKSQFDSIQNSSSKMKQLMHDAGVNSMDALGQAYTDVMNGKGSPEQKKLIDALDSSGAAAAHAYASGFKVMATEVGKALGMTGPALDAFVNRMHNMNDLMMALGAPVESVTQAQQEYTRALNDSEAKGQKLTDAQKLKILNTYREKAGLADVTDVTLGFNDATGGAAQAADAAASAFSGYQDAATNLSDALGSLTSAQAVQVLKGAYSGAANDAFSQAANLAQAHEQAIENGIQAAGQAKQNALQAQQKATDQSFANQQKALEAAQKAETDAQNDHFKQLNAQLDAQSKAVTDEADTETKAIQAKIDSLTKEDTVRQTLFNNEQTRIQRLAQLQNNNIDFNAALNMGNLDQAAKIYSSNAATVQDWAITDQQQAMDAASKAQQDQLKSQIDAINAAKDAKLQAIQDEKSALADQQQAEQDALQQSQQNAKDELDARKQAADDALQAAIDAQTKNTQNALTNQQQRYQNQQLYLNLELDTLKASVPRTQDEYNTLISNIESAYAKYGVNLQADGDLWSGYLGQSLNTQITDAALSLQSDIGWSQIGQFIDGQISSNMGVSLDTVVNYLKTGQWNPVAPTTAPAWQPRQADTGYKLRASHTGGMPFSPGERTGYPVNAPLFSTEHLALLEEGEFVVKKKAAQANLGLLQAINDGHIMGRHIGGPIGLFSGNDLMMTSMLAYAAMGMAGAQHAASAAKLADQANYINSTYGPVGGAPTSVSGNVAIVMNMARQNYGWTGPEWDALYQVMMMESGFRNTAQNPTSTAYGMFQFLDSTWAGYGIPKTSDPTLQTIAGLRYIASRYGDPLGALAHERAFHWYDTGGKWPTGTLGLNGTGKPEFVFTEGQWGILRNLALNSVKLIPTLTEMASNVHNVASESTGNYNIQVHLNGPVNSQIDFERGVERALEKFENQRGRNRTITS